MQSEPLRSRRDYCSLSGGVESWGGMKFGFNKVAAIRKGDVVKLDWRVLDVWAKAQGDMGIPWLKIVKDVAWRGKGWVRVVDVNSGLVDVVSTNPVDAMLGFVTVPESAIVVGRKDDMLTVAQVREICASCADKMERKGIKGVRASLVWEAVVDSAVKTATKRICGQWDSLPKGWTEKSLKSFWDSLTGDKVHKIKACIKAMEGKVDDPGAFCGSLARRVGYEPD